MLLISIFLFELEELILFFLYSGSGIWALSIVWLQSGVFVLVSRLSEFVSESFKSGLSFPFSSVVFLEIFPCWF